MKQVLKYILLIITVFSFGRVFSQQSFITAKLIQVDSICEGTTGVMKLAMFNSVKTEEQKVSHFKLMFEYDATIMEIKNITTESTILENFEFKDSYPSIGQCMITDSLNMPNNFWAESIEVTALVFEISFNGLKQGTEAVRFISDSCYFKTEEDENIAAFYHDSPDVNIHPGFISMTLAQTGKGCSYEDKGQAEVTVLDGASPYKDDYKYEWSDGMQNPYYPYQIGQLPEGELSLRVIDDNGCLYDTTMMIETLRAPEMDWMYASSVPPDYTEVTEFAVKEHPIHFYVDFTKVNSELGFVHNWYWELYYTDSSNPDSLKNLWEDGKRDQTDFNHVFQNDGDYEVRLSARLYETGCDTTVIKPVKVEPAELKFKNLVTPGNNRFKITANGETLRDVFVSHELIIQDRTGRRVYDTKNFPDDGWDGGGCPNGTYYFILKAKSTRKEYKYQGTLVILGGNN